MRQRYLLQEVCSGIPDMKENEREKIGYRIQEKDFQMWRINNVENMNKILEILHVQPNYLLGMNKIVIIYYN